MRESLLRRYLCLEGSGSGAGICALAFDLSDGELGEGGCNASGVAFSCET